MSRGCVAYLAFVIDSKNDRVELKIIPIIKEFLDVFLEELPGFLLVTEVEVLIDILLSASFIAQTLYWMAPA